ncbi:MAG: 4Fe-4S dicluster domain-containing protein [Sedimentisphaerales bacterium]|nr:4Fe-4S dicluster domain-containing protein [Sedimentisphaerales bacterium]
MKLKGGYNILLAGRPGSTVEVLPEPEVLYLPLRTKRFDFGDICVKDGQHVELGEVLAKDAANFSIPLLSPRAGVVRLNAAEGHIVLEDITKYQKQPKTEQANVPHVEHGSGTVRSKIEKMVSLGAWEFFCDAYDGNVPDPDEKPQAVIVSTVSLEPFLSRGDAQLKNRLLKFTRGLEHLQSLLEYQPMYLVMPQVRSSFASKVKDHLRGYAWVKLIEVRSKYPYDNFNILARRLKLKKDGGPVWCIKTEGVLATDRALTRSSPCLARILSIGGPEAKNPVHVKGVTGYPIKTILDKYANDDNVRVICGGMLTGQTCGEGALGIDSECRGLTLMPEHTEREFLGFVRPGFDRSSYAPCFLSALRLKHRESFSTAMRGEGRPCVSCNFCEEVCPAGIMPHLLHKYLYKDLIEEADEARIDLCVRCGLCSFVCPSKIELTKQFIEAQDLIEKEKEEARLDAIRQEKKRMEEARRKEAQEKGQEEEY